MKSDFKFSNLLGTVYKSGNLLFSKDGNTLISPVGNRITLFDLINNKSITLPIETSHDIVKLALSPKGNLLFTADAVGQGLLINLSRKFILHKFNFAGKVKDLKFSPCGKYFAYAVDKQIQIWRTPNLVKEVVPFVKVYQFTQHFDTVTSVSWSPDSKYLLSSSVDLTCKLHPVFARESNSKVVSLAGHKDTVIGGFFSQDMEHIYTVSRDGQCLDWQYTSLRTKLNAQNEADEDLATKFTENRLDRVEWMVVNRNYFQQNKAKVSCVYFHPKSNLMMVGFSIGTFGIWELPEFVNLHTLSISQSKVSTVVSNDSGEWLGLGISQLGQLLVWEWQSESFILKQQSHHFNITSMAFATNGQLLVTGGLDGKVKLWDSQSGFSFVTFEDHRAAISEVQFTKKGQVFLSASLDGTIRAYDLLRYRNFQTLTTPQPVQFSTMTTDPLGDVVVAGCKDSNEVFLWSLQNGKLLEMLAGHTAPVVTLAFNPTKNQIASGSWDGTVRVWDTFARSQTSEVLPVNSEVLAVTYRNDGKQLAVASLDGTITLWDPEENKLLATIEGRNDIQTGRKSGDKVSAKTLNSNSHFTTLSYTDDGTHILAAGNSRFVCLYNCQSAVLVRKFVTSKNRSMDGIDLLKNSKNMTEAGINLSDIDDDFEDEDEKDRLKFKSDSMPGVQHGDLGKRRFKPEITIKKVQFSSDGRAWAAATTEGLIIYSLDENFMFDPFLLDLDVTPKSILDTLGQEKFLEAFVMALQLNEFSLLTQVFEAVPPQDISLILQQLQPTYLKPTLKFLASYVTTSTSANTGTRHLEFLVLWVFNILNIHSKFLKSRRAELDPQFRTLQRFLNKFSTELANLVNGNVYTVKYLIEAAMLGTSNEEGSGIELEEEDSIEGDELEGDDQQLPSGDEEIDHDEADEADEDDSDEEEEDESSE